MNRHPHLIHRILVILALTALLVLILPVEEIPLASPQTAIIVNTLDDDGNDHDGDCSLREAIRAANLNSSQDGCPVGTNTIDTITFSVSGTIMLNAELLNPELQIIAGGPLVIDGAGVITISGGDAVQIFYISPVGDLTLEGLSLVDGYHAEAGGAIANYGVLAMDNVNLSSSSSTQDGGGIFNHGTLTITGSTLSGNAAAASGGGIYNDAPIPVTISSSNLSGNSSGNSGGGIANLGNMTINDSTFTGNSAGSTGGAIINYSALNVNGSTLSGNDAQYGGGIDNTGTLNILGSSLSGNSADEHGGGIYTDDTLTLTDSTLFDNDAKSGGGITNWSGGTVDIIGSTLAENNAEFTGGAIYNDGTTNLHNSTLSGNSAVSLGGGIFNDGGLFIEATTLSGNSSDLVYGGGAINNAGLASLQTSIIGNSPAGGNCAGIPLADLGDNIEDANSCGLDPADGSMINTDPLLGLLQDNGGPSWTHALLFGSLAIDAVDPADCPVVDQRGVTRPQDGDADGASACDIGAYELGLFLDPAYLEEIASPGETVEYEITLYNHSSLSDTYALTAHSAEWITDLSTTSIGPLLNGDSQTFTLTVTIPLANSLDTTGTVVVSAAQPGDSAVEIASSVITIQVVPWEFYLPLIARTD